MPGSFGISVVSESPSSDFPGTNPIPESSDVSLSVVWEGSFEAPGVNPIPGSLDVSVLGGLWVPGTLAA